MLKIVSETFSLKHERESEFKVFKLMSGKPVAAGDSSVHGYNNQL